MELLFIVSVLTWLGILLYLLSIHVRQRKLSRSLDRILDMPLSSKEEEEP